MRTALQLLRCLEVEQRRLAESGEWSDRKKAEGYYSVLQFLRLQVTTSRRRSPKKKG